MCFKFELIVVACLEIRNLAANSYLGAVPDMYFAWMFEGSRFRV